MSKFKFSYCLLLFMSILTVCMGLSFSIMGLMDGSINMTSTLLFFWTDVSTISSSALNYSNWSLGMLGASITGLGILLVFIVKSSFKKGEKGAWLILIIYLFVWFILEVLITIKYSVTPLLFQNIFYFLGFLIPLILTKSDFYINGEVTNEK